MNAVERGERKCARLAAVVLAAVCGANCGCLVIACDWSGKKAGLGDKICQSHAVETFDVDAATLRQACHHALRGRNMAVASDTTDGGVNNIESADKNNEKVAIRIEHDESRGAGPRTIVSVRMTTNGDGDESRRILKQIEAFVAGATLADTQRPGPVLPVSATDP